MKIKSGPIAIIGAGLSGLSAAIELEKSGESCLIFDENSHLGGKLETTEVEGNYLLDRGFQVLLPSYPELQEITELSRKLDLQYFASGARLETESGSTKMGDPFKEPRYLFSTMFGNYASLKDKLLVLKLQMAVRNGAAESLLSKNSGSTLEYLRAFGFSEKIIFNFWRPFFSGIFLENKLSTSAGFFLYLVRMFASSPVAIPRNGVGELPKLLASQLARTEIRLNTSVKVLTSNRLEFADGQTSEYKAVISATKGVTSKEDSGPFGHVTSYWFASPEAPFSGPWLSLCNRPESSINHVAVLSNVSSSYAAKGDSLVCVNVVNGQKAASDGKIKDEAELIYGPSVRHWRLLRMDQLDRPFPLYLNRTDLDTPSQQGAISKGRQAARKTLNQLN